MAPKHLLPRVPAFPITGEKSALTILGSGLCVPASVHDDCPLIGKEAPELILPDHLGRRCSLHATIALGRPIILFFFPLAGSPHCTKESCGFRDALGLTPIFSDLQAIVIGISQDPPTRSKRFVDEHHLGYLILHDEKREAMDLYGVPRTWMGLIDQRCTFVIDPSGLVRSMAQGVLDADGHVKFAERWLIRLEDELSQRSRQTTAYQSSADNLMLDETTPSSSQMRTAYGEQNSAQIGGIDVAPRYGAMSNAPSKRDRSASHVKDARRGVNKPIDGEKSNMWKNWRHVLQQLSSPDDKPPPLVLARHASKAASDETKATSEKSIKRSMQSGFARTLPRSRSGANLKDSTKAKVPSSRRASLSRRSVSGAEPDNGVKASATSAPETQDDVPPPVPPLFAALEAVNGGGGPALHAGRNGATAGSSPHSGAGNTHDVDGSDREASVWGTDSSLSSHVSTTATSMTGSRQSLGSLGAAAGLMHNGQHITLAKPAVTSEILMPGDVLDLSKGDVPIVIRESQKPVDTGLGAQKSAARRTVVHSFSPMGQDPASAIDRNSRGLQSADFVAATPIAPPLVSNGIVHRGRRVSNHVDIPTDVPQDEHDDESLEQRSHDVPANAYAKDEQVDVRDLNIVRQPVNGDNSFDSTSYAPSLSLSGRSFSQQSAQSSGRTTPRSNRPTPWAAAAENAQSHTMSNSPRGKSSSTAAAEDDVQTFDDEKIKAQHRLSSYPSNPSSLASKQRSSSLANNDVYRISAYQQQPPLSMADRFTSQYNGNGQSFGEAEPNLSPRPRSVRLGESHAKREDGRLRRPMNPPKDIPPVSRLARHARQLSLTDTPPQSRNGARESLDGEGSQNDDDEGMIQHVVRRTSARPEQPVLVNRHANTSATAAAIHTPSQSVSSIDKYSATSTPMSIQGGGGFGAGQEAQANNLSRSVSSSATSSNEMGSMSPEEVRAAPLFGETPTFDKAQPLERQAPTLNGRRPSSSSMGTFGRRVSPTVSDEEFEE